MGILEEKIAVVIGASDPNGIGAATARRFAREGAHVIVAARRKSGLTALAEEIGGSAVECDITDERMVAKLVDEALASHGRIDIAVNCAGANFGGAIDELSEETFLPQIRLHLMGTGFFIKQMARGMKAGGSIVTISSVTVSLAAPGLGIYTATKAGADQLVRVAAVEYGAKGIRINSLAPGFTRSPITEAYFAHDSLVKAFENETPLGRLGTVEDAANAALWLASDECFATGQIVQVNGGASLRRAPSEREMFPG